MAASPYPDFGPLLRWRRRPVPMTASRGGSRPCSVHGPWPHSASAGWSPGVGGWPLPPLLGQARLGQSLVAPVDDATSNAPGAGWRRHHDRRSAPAPHTAPGHAGHREHNSAARASIAVGPNRPTPSIAMSTAPPTGGRTGSRTISLLPLPARRCGGTHTRSGLSGRPPGVRTTIVDDQAVPAPNRVLRDFGPAPPTHCGQRRPARGRSSGSGPRPPAGTAPAPPAFSLPSTAPATPCVPET